MIIGLSGKKQSGKSTVTNYLVSNRGFTEMSWAEPLKEIVGRQLFGLTDVQLYGDDVAMREGIDPFWGMSPRQILQIAGTEMFRSHICDDFWVKLGIRKIQGLMIAQKNIVVSDCRFMNEVDALKNLGGKIIRIKKIDAISTDTHPSETALDYYEDFDAIISAHQGDIESLYKKIDYYLEVKPGRYYN